MITFANQLSKRILLQEKFWDDFTSLTSFALTDKLSKNCETTTYTPSRNALIRLTESASFFAQSNIEEHRSLSQDIAVYLILISKEEFIQDVACNILSLLGNQPGASFLRRRGEVKNTNWKSYLQTHLLRKANEVSIGDQKLSLTDYQIQLWNLLVDKKSVAVSAPTSAGKTFLILEHILRETNRLDEICSVIIVPTRALLTELHTKITEHEHFDSESTRASTVPTLDSDKRKKQIFILTQERLQVLLSISNIRFTYVIVDEAQAISDGTRGIILHDCIDRVSTSNPKIKFLFLTPGATNLDKFQNITQTDELKIKETSLGPVVQNRIVVKTYAAKPKELSLELMRNGKRLPLANIEGQRGFTQPSTVASAVALELGKEGSSLVYATGPAKAEKTAAQIASSLPEIECSVLDDLVKFINAHVHPKYSLIETIKKGVGFHYGKMPSLLRIAIEEAFTNGHLKYLVCTTTLFQGVNLPAKNVFIATSKRGTNDQLDPAALWNFIGRAGRLGKEPLGNIYLINYDNWEQKPLEKRKKFKISPSFKSTVLSNYKKLSSYLEYPEKFDNTELTPELETSAGLLISKSSNNTVLEFLNRSLGDSITSEQKENLRCHSNALLESIDIPTEVVTSNWTVSPLGQKRLKLRFKEKIKEGNIESLIPINPQESNAYQRYIAVFSRLNKQINGKSSSSAFNNKLTYQALAWMRGKPLPEIIKKEVAYVESENESTNVNTAIRNTLAFIEDELRFRYVQLGRCYVDLLRNVLIEEGFDKEAAEVYDFALALELGVSSSAGQIFIELGLSRITASVLENAIPDSDPTAKTVREWITGLNKDSVNFSAIIWDELIRKGLREENKEQ